MKPTITESQWRDQVVQIARLYGWRVAFFRAARTMHGWKTAVGADGAGYPDLTLTRERVVFAELKVGNGRLRPEQQEWLDALQAAGAECYVWRPADWDEVVAVLRPKGAGRRT